MDSEISAYDRETQRLESVGRRIARVSLTLTVLLRILTFFLQ